MGKLTPMSEANDTTGLAPVAEGDVDGLSTYFAGIAEKPLLSPTEERRMARRARAGCRKSKDQLVERNLRLVIPTAKKYRGQGLGFEDLIQEGNAGLITAADKFDSEMGYRFSTYATWWIRQSIGRAVAERSRTIRVPVQVSDNRNKLYVAARDFEAVHHRQPTVAELEELTGLGKEAIEWAYSVPQTGASLEDPVRSDERDGSALGDMISDSRQSEEVLEEALDVLSRQQIASALSVLSEKERWIVERRYGLDGGDGATLREIGEEMGSLYQHVGAVNRRALRRLWTSLRQRGVEGSELDEAS